MIKPRIYVASSWRNNVQPVVVEALLGAGYDPYDFKNPPNGAGFGWEEISLTVDANGLVTQDNYLDAIGHPRAEQGFESDFGAMMDCDALVMVLPCNRSAHLELGWAVGAGKPTCILLDDPMTPELMYKMVDAVVTTIPELLDWLRDTDLTAERPEPTKETLWGGWPPEPVAEHVTTSRGITYPRRGW